MSVCRSCGAEVRWVVVVDSNRRMPLDPDPAGDGTVVVLSGGETAHVLSREERARRLALPGGPGPLFRSHFSTCPNAVEHRRR